MLDLYFVSVIAFFIILGLVIFADRKKIEIKSYVIFMRRTKRFRILIDEIAQFWPGFWKTIGTFGIIVCFLYMLLGTGFLINSSYNIAAGLVDKPTISLVLPTPFSQASIGPGYMSFPFWSWFLIILMILIPHELSHGILSRTEKIKLKSVGLLLLVLSPIALFITGLYGLIAGALTLESLMVALFLILPGAFVEPDEKQLKKAKTITRLRVFAGGSAANIFVGLTVFMITAFILWPAMISPGVDIFYVNQSSPASNAGLTNGTIITHINNIPVSVSYCEYNNGGINAFLPYMCKSGSGYFVEEIGQAKIGDNIQMRSDEKTYDILVKAVEVDGIEYPFVGILYKPIIKNGDPGFLFSLISFMSLLWIFSFAVAIFNILPIYPLDGGLMVETIIERFNKKSAKKIARAISLIVLLILLYNFFGPLLM
ncbi:MAG: site-2 protease family protein [Nanoarchaeota archaeon]|nr:site-2 protease family protein [Nanoarchaeota archaeon]